jgi:hypothetical protein
VLTNCSNNYGPWQFTEKLIPVVILKAAAGEPIPLYGDGQHVRDWITRSSTAPATTGAMRSIPPGSALSRDGSRSVKKPGVKVKLKLVLRSWRYASPLQKRVNQWGESQGQ